MKEDPISQMPSQYVYGIVPSEFIVPSDLSGVKGHPVETCVAGDFAAVVTPIEDVESLGTPDDLLAHSAVLDRIAAAGPVLPMVFGTVVPDAEVLTDQVLPSMQDVYAAGLRRVRDAAQFTVRARYVRDVALAEIVSENPEVARLREATAGLSEEASHFDRIRLGELVVEDLRRKAAGDSDVIVNALAPLARETVTREAGHADDVVELAALVDQDSQQRFEQAVENLAKNAVGRITFRLLGPQAPYDFVGEV
ncbi:GvpL/GvpF family gas vesicle protein [Arthrobacter sp. I2-34]|uniref:GvpL/GvpF family gas vesicle protein n=1 Tax=Arthrobacter hankyongi TaxID=2904801 RepID=A0ABS9L8D6_9MICC|nr:GvpL/GvpF family gas vesicle protein [Arthrobacter hankyongi]MCG2622762.1 GvpL/GvpF family gas vesicle protein [Arthrobacter hankyongi]